MVTFEKMRLSINRTDKNKKHHQKKKENRTALSQTDMILLSFDKFDLSKKKPPKTSPSISMGIE